MTNSLAVFHHQGCSRADYRLEITVHSYSNPGGRCAERVFGGNCCEDSNKATCDDNMPDPYFIFCLGGVGETASQCRLGRKESKKESHNKVFLTFAVGDTALLGLPNPLPFNVTVSLPVSEEI